MMIHRADPSSLSLLALLQQHFPDVCSELGEPGAAPTPVDVAALCVDLDGISSRVRRQMSVIMGVVLVWLGLQLIVALLTKDPYASVIALGASGGGVLWCVSTLLRTAKQLFFADTLVAAAKRDPQHLKTLAALAREQLGFPRRRPAATPKRKPAAA